mmetsp:Transcript_30364/g.65535  ORF Transcript_30364/g.65535 Transcript_30364/m.65535 type:complete len:204 (-) Transcript_30364:114-725(-)
MQKVLIPIELQPRQTRQIRRPSQRRLSKRLLLSIITRVLLFRPFLHLRGNFPRTPKTNRRHNGRMPDAHVKLGPGRQSSLEEPHLPHHRDRTPYQLDRSRTRNDPPLHQFRIEVAHAYPRPIALLDHIRLPSEHLQSLHLLLGGQSGEFDHVVRTSAAAETRPGEHRPLSLDGKAVIHGKVESIGGRFRISIGRSHLRLQDVQ